MKQYDYLIVGAGLFGSVFAREMTKVGKKCLVLERRPWSGGNIRTEEHDGIHIHMYGAHIFHTNDVSAWKYMQQFAEFNHYVNSPIANYNGELYNMPFNMNTFYAMWGVTTSDKAKQYIEQNRPKYDHSPHNLEEQALSMVGYDIYNKLIKGYTEKQWGRKCTELPPEIIKRLPLRFTFDNNYFNSRYQGIPIGGFSKIIDKLLKGCEVRYNIDYHVDREHYNELADKILYTGALDEYFDYRLGRLEYRGLKFETECLPIENYQSVAVMNYTSADVPYTRSIEHKHFEFGTQPVTYVTKEYPARCISSDEAFYPVNDRRNQDLYSQYMELAKNESNLIIGGRLALYKYYDMDQIVSRALSTSQTEISSGTI